MRQIYRARAQTPAPDPTKTGSVPSESADAWVGYTADHAALAFGIPRIAPVVRERAGSDPGGGDGSEAVSRPDPAERFSAVVPAEVEDLTESLTTDERESGSAFPEPGPEGLQERLAAQSAAQALSDPVTAALRLPSSTDREPRAAWGRASRPALTERLVVAPDPTRPLMPNAAPRAARWTAVLSHLGRGPEEAATTTVTLPAAAESAAALALATTHDSLVPLSSRLARWVLLGAGGALAFGLAMLAGRALTLADWWPGTRPGAVAPRPTPAYQEHLLAQALTALRAGRREQAVALLSRYQAGAPSPDQAVEIMLRVLKKDLGGPAH